MASVEFTGKDLEEAIDAAAASLILPPEKVKFTVLTMGSRGFLGLGRRKARISVDPDDPALGQSGDARAENRERMKRPPANVTGDGPKEAAASRAMPSASKRAEGDKPRSRANFEARFPVGGGASAPGDEPALSGRHRASAPVEVKPLDWSHIRPPLTCPARDEAEAVEFSSEPAGRLAGEVVGEIIGRMGIEARAICWKIGPRLVVTLDSPDNALLIGNRGRTLEALQLLATKIFQRRFSVGRRPGFGENAEGPGGSPKTEPGLAGSSPLRNDSFPPASDSGPDNELRLILDVGDYRARRQVQLLEHLKNLAERVRSSGQAQTFSGLNPSERRLMMLALRPFKDLAVSTVGGRESLVVTKAAGRLPRPPRNRPRSPEKGSAPNDRPGADTAAAGRPSRRRRRGSELEGQKRTS